MLFRSWQLTMAWSPDGKILATGMNQGHLFIAQAGEEEAVDASENTVSSADEDPFTKRDPRLDAPDDYRRIGSRLFLWDPNRQRQLVEVEQDCRYPQVGEFSPDGRFLVTSGTIFSRSVPRGSLRRQFYLWDVEALLASKK